MIHISRECRIVDMKRIIKILPKELFMITKTLTKLIYHIVVGDNTRIVDDEVILIAESKKRTPIHRSNKLLE